MFIMYICGYLIGFIIGLILWKIDKCNDNICCEDCEWGARTLIIYPTISFITTSIILTIKLWTLFILGLIIAIIIVIYGDNIIDYIKKRRCK